MTTIPEAPNEESAAMEFVNWDATAASTGFDWPNTLDENEKVSGFDSTSTPAALVDPSLDLVFGDITSDDWSVALHDYESTQIQQNTDISGEPQGTAPATSQFSWEIAEAPCINCSQWAYQCKRIREGKHKGYCTGCVALRKQCSFGLSTTNSTSEVGTTFPVNPWPTVGDRPETSIVHENEIPAVITSGSGVSTAPAVGETPPSPQAQSQTQPKIGARFSRESVKVLKNWIATHSHHPYPTDEQRENLQKITGLNKTQITNWLANARRRGKLQPTRAVSPHIGRGYAQPIDINVNKNAPSPFEYMNPLQRWENSPPENEPASVIAIARAVSASGSYPSTSGAGRSSPNPWSFSDDGSRSICNQSSTSSFGTSHSSNGSFASLLSSQSLSSSIPSFVRSNRGRRRRRRVLPKLTGQQLNQPPKTFQCTFCTESFRTKHDWQRHEKSLHLSLERWICSPDGPRAAHPDNGQMSCVFCGEANPDDAHIEVHNFSSCVEHTQEERTFYRKDHLRQHLRLVHDVSFLPWSMEKWRVESPAIRSQCGFCGVTLDSWTNRVEHLADHFRSGYTMADWKGDWGFDASILELVENSIPPYLIHDERQSPLPFRASQPSSATPTNAYDLLKIELQWWMANKPEEVGASPSDATIQLEACRILYGAEVLLKRNGISSSSWLCDLVMSSEEANRQAAFRPRAPGSNCLSSLRINGKSNIFEGCLFEKELQDFVRAKAVLGLTAMDHELQDEACRILVRIEEKSSNPDEMLVNWFIRMIKSSTFWLEDFRRRAGLPRSEDVGDPHQRSTDPKTIDSTVHNYSRLELELGRYLDHQRSVGSEPTDSDLQNQARLIVYEVEDQWNQTAADDKDWLGHFRERHPPITSGSIQPTELSLSGSEHASATIQSSPTNSSRIAKGSSHSPSGSTTGLKHPRARFLNDANCYRRMAEDLSRYVAATMSPHNPNRHVPTDEELIYQARWIVYDDDDPFNRTAANNIEWLQRFKVDAGLLPPETGPGLGMWGGSSVFNDSTGFEPPYAYTEPAAMADPLESTTSAASKLQKVKQYYSSASKIFCSRDLERGLTEYVKREVHKTGVFPSDTQLQERAREILNVQRTPCDDAFILGKFKASLQESIPEHLPPGTGSGMDFVATVPASAPTALEGLAPSLLAQGSTLSAPIPDMWPAEVDFDLNVADQELENILEQVSRG